MDSCIFEGFLFFKQPFCLHVCSCKVPHFVEASGCENHKSAPKKRGWVPWFCRDDALLHLWQVPHSVEISGPQSQVWLYIMGTPNPPMSFFGGSKNTKHDFNWFHQIFTSIILDTPDGCLTSHNWDSCELRHLLHGERPLFGAATVAAAPSWFEATHHELLVATGEFYVELRDDSWQRVDRIIENLQIVFLLFDAKPSEASSQIFCLQKKAFCGAATNCQGHAITIFVGLDPKVSYANNVVSPTISGWYEPSNCRFTIGFATWISTMTVSVWHPSLTHVFSPIIARSCGISHLCHHPLCHRIGSGREIPGVKIRHPVIMMHIDYKPTGCISFLMKNHWLWVCQVHVQAMLLLNSQPPLEDETMLECFHISSTIC